MTEMTEADAKKYIGPVADKLSDEDSDKLLNYVMSGKYGTFRYLVYDVLGWPVGGGYWCVDWHRDIDCGASVL